MMSLLSIGFSQPWLLIALISIPALWILLRLNPPRPQSIPFPPFPLLSNTLKAQPEPRRLPLWLLLIRLLLCILVITAMAGPIIDPEHPLLEGSNPLLIVMDDDWTAAPDWADRQTMLDEIMSEAERTMRPVALLALGNHVLPKLGSAAALRDQIRTLSPKPYAQDRSLLLAPLQRFFEEQPSAEVTWIATGIIQDDQHAFLAPLKNILKDNKITLISNPSSRIIALAGTTNGPEGLSVRLVRANKDAEKLGLLRAYDSKSRVIGETPFHFETIAKEIIANFVLPTELRNEISRIEIDGQHSAGAIAFIDGQSRRRKIGLVSGVSADAAQPLLSPNWFVSQALRPYADLIEPRGGANEAIATLIENKPSLIVLTDIGTLSPDTEKKLSNFLKSGGVVLRFAGPRTVAVKDELLPVRIRPGDRSLGGALTWEAPKHLAPFKPDSPFNGVEAPEEIAITRQLLAEPDADLARKTWAALSDGTPIVTAERHGNGLLVLFHVTADTTWSNLPISGTFVGMLRRIVTLSNRSEPTSPQATTAIVAAPYLTLNGFGVLGSPTANDKPIENAVLSKADIDHAAGLYGDPENPSALNVLTERDTLTLTDFEELNAKEIGLHQQASYDLRPLLLVLAAILFAVDTLATVIVRGGRNLLAYRLSKATVLPLLLLLAWTMLCNPSAHATPLAPKDAEGPLLTHFAYVVTGDATIDEISRAGLASLSTFLAEHTALEPGDPVGVDLTHDDLAVYPLLYWPMAPERPLPTVQSLEKVDAFMRDGGTVVFDTRDATLTMPGLDTTPETKALRRILANLSIPALEPVPSDHVLTKAFYLINRFPGRYAEGTTWIEALPKSNQDMDEPVHAGDGVSSIIITSNDLAAAWASDRDGQPLYPLTQSMPRQREMAMRAGTNIAMYVLTGNYKADQVHVPALLDRLGR